MQNEIFYVYPQNPKLGHDPKGNVIADKTTAIAAKFLIVNGNPVADPNPQGSSRIHIYTKLNSNGQIDEASIFSNPHNYLIVPANYTPSEAQAFAEKVHAMSTVAALATMYGAFQKGGSQDLQRGKAWGVPNGDSSLAFRDSASWHLGYVTELSGVSPKAAITGGALTNIRGYIGTETKHWFGGPAPKQMLDGPMGMSEDDYKDFLQGRADARKTRETGLKGFYKQLRNSILGNAKTSAAPQANSLHNLALALGHTGLGSFAPVGNVTPPAAKTAARNTTGGAAPFTAGAVRTGAGTGAQTPPGAAGGAEVTGYKAVLAQAKAQAAQARQNRVAARQAAYLQPGAGGLGGVSFAPSGGFSGRTARFAGRAGTAEAEIPVPGAAAASAGSVKITPAVVRSLDASGAENNLPGMDETAPGAMTQTDFGRALENYVFQQSRLPPAGSAAFNPYLSPAWAGLKLPA